MIRSRRNLSSRSSTRMPIWKMEQGGKRDVEDGTGTVERINGNEKRYN